MLQFSVVKSLLELTQRHHLVVLRQLGPDVPGGALLAQKVRAVQAPGARLPPAPRVASFAVHGRRDVIVTYLLHGLEHVGHGGYEEVVFQAVHAIARQRVHTSGLYRRFFFMNFF